MASFGGDLDILAGTIGSQLITCKNEQGIDVQGVFIPIAYNQMKVYRDKNGRNHATIPFGMWPANPGIVNFWKQQRLQAGDEITPYSVPTHRIELNIDKEYRRKLTARAKKVALAMHKDDWNTPELQDEKKNKELQTLIYSLLPSDLCTSVWMHRPTTQVGGAVAPQLPDAGAAADAKPWSPNFDKNGNMAGGVNIPDGSDLPF